jgi:hypothetical protein
LRRQCLMSQKFSLRFAMCSSLVLER